MENATVGDLVLSILFLSVVVCAGIYFLYNIALIAIGAWISADAVNELINNDDSIEISFDDFVKFHSLNPSRYELRLDCVYCNGAGMISSKTRLDLLKYRRWIRRRAIAERQKSSSELMVRFLNLVQEDIDEQMRIARKEIESNDMVYYGETRWLVNY